MFFSNWNKETDEEKIYRWTEFFHKLDNKKWKIRTGARATKQNYISIYISLYMKTFFKTGIYIYIYNLHGLSCQEKVSRFSMLLIPRYGTSLAVSHWKLRMVLMVEYRSSRLDQNKPFSGPVSTLLSSSADSTVSACPVAYAPLDLLH